MVEEILRAVFHQFDLPTLVVASEVCKAWRFLSSGKFSALSLLLTSTDIALWKPFILEQGRRSGVLDKHGATLMHYVAIFGWHEALPDLLDQFSYVITTSSYFLSFATYDELSRGLDFHV